MSEALRWDEVGQRTYTTGVDHLALYVAEGNTYPKGVAWNGVTAINESPSGADENAIYADNIKYLSIRAAEDFGLTIECYDTPEEFDECDGCATPNGLKGVTVHQQSRKTFGLAYRTQIGNDTEGIDYGYELHLVWGCSASPSEIAHNTINESVEPGTLSYEVTTVAVPVEGMKATARMTINVREFLDADPDGADKIKALETVLFGGDLSDVVVDVREGVDGPRLPMPNEVIAILTDPEEALGQSED